MNSAELDFSLPQELIAKQPVDKRDSSRLMVLHKNGNTEEKQFSELIEYLDKGDLLLLNDTKVFPARLAGDKSTGGRLEILLVRKIGSDVWEILCRKKYSGTLKISDEFTAEIVDGKTACFNCNGGFFENLWKYGLMPLPPYIKRQPDFSDKERYQTVYAEKTGSIAAPTAGLHFTQDMLQRIKEKGVIIKYLTLHVGIGTFKPIRAGKMQDHKMLSEFFEIDTDVIENIKKAKASGKKVFAVGTTTTRAIEGYLSGKWTKADAGCPMQDANVDKKSKIRGTTDIFIYPGYAFKAVDSLITNFHLPHSTPLMLAAAFSSPEKLMDAYKTAVAREYRFFSYGDAMLIL